MSRKGVALLMAMAVLASLGMIVLTGFALARAERVAGLAAVAEVQARGAAEMALSDALLGWNPALTPLTAGGEVPVAWSSSPGPSFGQANIKNLGGPVFAILASGARTDAAGGVLASVWLELLVLADSIGPDSLVHPRKFPLGWRVVP